MRNALEKLKYVANILNAAQPQKFTKRCLISIADLCIFRIFLQIYQKRNEEYSNVFNKMSFGTLTTYTIDWHLAAALDHSLLFVRGYSVFLFPYYVSIILLLFTIL